MGGWVLKMKLMLTQLSTKLKLKLKLSLAKTYQWILWAQELTPIGSKPSLGPLMKAALHGDFPLLLIRKFANQISIPLCDISNYSAK